MLFFFFFNDTATTEIYTLSLHDALPISDLAREQVARQALDAARPVGVGAEVDRERHRERVQAERGRGFGDAPRRRDRKSTRLNSSHLVISYAVFCLKKKKRTISRLAFMS